MGNQALLVFSSRDYAPIPEQEKRAQSTIPGERAAALWQRNFWEYMGEHEVPECPGQSKGKEWSQQEEGRCQGGKT